MGGQIIYATVVPAPKQRNSEDEQAVIKEGKIPEGFKARPAKVRQNNRDARWMVKYSKVKVKEGGDPKGFKPVNLLPSRCSATRTTSVSTGPMG